MWVDQFMKVWEYGKRLPYKATGDQTSTKGGNEKKSCNEIFAKKREWMFKNQTKIVLIFKTLHRNMCTRVKKTLMLLNLGLISCSLQRIGLDFSFAKLISPTAKITELYSNQCIESNSRTWSKIANAILTQVYASGKRFLQFITKSIFVPVFLNPVWCLHFQSIFLLCCPFHNEPKNQ